MRKLTTLALIGAFIFGTMTMISCEKGGGGGNNGNDQIALTDPDDEEQTAWADDDEKTVSFEAKSSWTASVDETTRAGSVDWIKLYVDGAEKYSGEAGTFDLVIDMEPNITNADRSAKITIVCGDGEINIYVDQKGVTSDGSSFNPVGTWYQTNKSGYDWVEDANGIVKAVPFDMNVPGKANNTGAILLANGKIDIYDGGFITASGTWQVQNGHMSVSLSGKTNPIVVVDFNTIQYSELFDSGILGYESLQVLTMKRGI